MPNKKNNQTKPRCGLCGKTQKLRKTACCNQWVCDDEDQYVVFSFEQVSCARNHRRYTLCGYHHTEEHNGSWKDCAACKDAFEAEIYVYYGTNVHNFEILENPPEYNPKHCAECQQTISLANDGYSNLGDEYWCERCTRERMKNLLPEAE